MRARDVQTSVCRSPPGPAPPPWSVRAGRRHHSAKPSTPSLLEEAAGITGLHSRRHEAELRLRAAETNLERLDDMLITLDTQLQSLKKQSARPGATRTSLTTSARPKPRFCIIAGFRPTRRSANAKNSFAQPNPSSPNRRAWCPRQPRTREESAAELVPLREAEAAAAAELQRLNIAREELDAEERRAQAAMEQWQTRLTQIEADLGRERGLAGEAKAALDRLGTEKAQIEQACGRRG